MRKIIAILLFVLSHQLNLLSQNKEIFIGLDVPLYYSFGYEQKIFNHLSLNGKLGILTKPFDVAILNTLKVFDADELLVNTIGDAFSVGISFQPTLKWYLRKTYVGLSYSFLILRANDCPTDAIENYYGISILDRRFTTLNLQSKMHNAGVIFGRKFDFTDTRFSLNLEFSILKTFASKSYLRNDQDQTLETLSNTIDQELNQYYIEYGYLPSINILFVYKF